jgi:hypothetical protein
MRQLHGGYFRQVAASLPKTSSIRTRNTAYRLRGTAQQNTRSACALRVFEYFYKEKTEG